MAPGQEAAEIFVLDLSGLNHLELIIAPGQEACGYLL